MIYQSVHRIGGYSFSPYYFEFWDGHKSRVNKRYVYELVKNKWVEYYLNYNIKLKKIKSFILDGDKTKISVRFRGREILK